jgi:hypothetical protein
MTSPEEDLRKRAIRRLEAKRDFYGHAAAYVAVNALLIAIWFISSRDAPFWPIWPLLGWGIGLAIHAWTVFGQRPITEADIQREMDREARRGP